MHANAYPPSFHPNKQQADTERTAVIRHSQYFCFSWFTQNRYIKLLQQQLASLTHWSAPHYRYKQPSLLLHCCTRDNHLSFLFSTVVLLCADAAGMSVWHCSGSIEEYWRGAIKVDGVERFAGWKKKEKITTKGWAGRKLWKDKIIKEKYWRYLFNFLSEQSSRSNHLHW